MPKILVSACLLGARTRYDGGDFFLAHPTLLRWIALGIVVPFCPEVAGNLPVPRLPAEIVGPGSGAAVLACRAHVVDRDGTDVTDPFVHGARLALDKARREGIELALLKENSPSCGSHSTHDGTFSGRRIPGAGVTAALLRQDGLTVVSEDEIDQLASLLSAGE